MKCKCDECGKVFLLQFHLEYGFGSAIIYNDDGVDGAIIIRDVDGNFETALTCSLECAKIKAQKRESQCTATN